MKEVGELVKRPFMMLIRETRDDSKSDGDGCGQCVIRKGDEY